MTAVDYVVRDATGSVLHGTFPAGTPSTIYVNSSRDISLNTSAADVAGYERVGSDLVVTMTDGQQLVLSGYYDTASVAEKNLYLSENGEIVAVQLDEAAEGAVPVEYATVEADGKWSAYDDLLFLDLDRVEPVVAPLAAPLISPLAGLLAGGAAVAATTLIDDNGGGDGGVATPTVDDAGETYLVGGTEDEDATISGTGEPGSEVVVTIGDETQTTTIGDDGTWETTFDPEDLPDDGEYPTEVEVTDPEDTEWPLDGPTVDIDTTPPDVAITEGVESTGDLVNAEGHEAGAVVAGTGEPGADLVLEVNGYSYETTIGDDGTWTVTLPEENLPEGEYSLPVTATATDAHGNYTVITDALIVDTIPPESLVDTVEGDDVINAVEAEDGVTVTGTGEPGATLVIATGGTEKTATVAEDGTWSVGYSAEEVEAGVYDIDLVVTSTDAAGNSSVTTHTVLVDTETTLTVDPIAGDNVIDGAEAAEGVTVTGTAEPGATVVVATEGGGSKTATANEDGTWSVSYGPGEVDAGTYDVKLTVTATDIHGNATSMSGWIHVDTETTLSVDPVAGDNVINGAEAAEGVTVTGTGEPGATLVVATEGGSKTTTVAEDGTWSVSYGPGEIAGGTYDAEITVTATDTLGNTTSMSGWVHVDTETTLTVDPVAGDNVIDAGEAAAGVTVSGTGEPGASVVVETEDGSTKTAAVAEDGTWSVTYASGEITGGTYDTSLSVTTTDLNGNVNSASTVVHVDTETTLTVDPVAGDNVIDGAEAAGDIAVTGTAEPGAALMVLVEGVEKTTTVADDGTWSVTYAAGEIAGGTYDAAVTVTATDALGNVATNSGSVHVDTETSVTLDETVAGDGVVNADEASGGVTLTGTAEAGASVEVAFQGVTRTVTAAADGSWSAAFAADEIAPGEYEAPVEVTATDAVGNTATTSGSVQVDTVTNVAIDDGQAGGDGVVNAAEAAGGVAFTGTVETGATVEVTVAGVTRTANVDDAGNWTAVFEAGTLPEGEYETSVTATAMDAAGNTASAETTVVVDTTTVVALDAGQAGGDDLMNGAESAAGVTLTGTAEPGATVEVTVEGTTRLATVSSDGSWAAVFEPGSIPGGEYDATVDVTATDAAGNTAATSGVLHVDTETDVSIDPNQAGGDDIVNAAEAEAGVVLTGNAEPGATVDVTVAGVTRAATVATDGSWTAAFAAGALPAGEYDTTITVASTDAAGNTASASQPIRIDTVAGEVTLSDLPIEIDDVINDAERADGVVINGTATPGLTVTVTLGEADTQVVADAAGNWSVVFPAGDIPEGVSTLPISASITDEAGNSASVSDSVSVDTVLDVSLDKPIESDDVINADERADGVSLSGTVEAGSTVVVALAGVERAATVDDDGNWTVDFAASDVPEGTLTAPITVTATDAAGNVAVLSDTVDVDTQLALTSDPDQTDDDVLNAVERTDGVSLSGTVEPGATVVVTLMGIDRAATVDPDGNWSVLYAADELPEGTYEATATVTATDTAGNSTSLTESFGVDTEIDNPGVDSVTFTGQDVWRISTQDSIDSYAVYTLETDGTVGEPEATVEQDPFFGTELTFTEPVSDGTNLVVNRVDDAGNTSATLVVLEDDADNSTTLGHAGLADFDLQTINLEYGEGTNLVLSEADVRSLSNSSNTLTIQGGDDDTVTATGAVATGESRTIEGDSYSVYTLGDDGTTLVIEDDITVII